MDPKLRNWDIDRFLHHLVEQDRSASTVENYGRDLQTFARWFEQSNDSPFSALALTATDVREYRQLLRQKKAAPATINRVIAALRAFATWAVAAGELDASPIDGVRGVEEQPHAPKWLEKADQGRLVRALEAAVNAAKTEAAKRQAIRDYAIVIMLLNTGLRVGELCALERSDVQLSERKGSVKVRYGKGGKQRVVPLNLDARRALRDWLKARPQTDIEALFVGKRLEPLQSSGVQRLLAEYGRRAGVEVTPHTTRHTFAKRLVDSGVSLDRVAALLGHASLNTTRIYTTPSERDLERAVAQLSE
jgi:integrase/recombinase XerC